MPKTKTVGLQDLREKLKNDGFNNEALDLIMGSWRPATSRLYDRFIEKWKMYALNHNIDPCNPAINNVANFLAGLFGDGMSYSSLNSARSALSAFLPFINGVAVGSHPTISRLMKGVFNKRPCLPKYSETWDVSVVLNFLSSLPCSEDLSFKLLTFRFVMLLCILTGQRGQALFLLKTSDIHINKDLTKCVITYSELHKSSKPGSHTKPAEIDMYPYDKKLCVVDHCRLYLEKTADLRKGNLDDKLFISLQRPHHSIARATFSRWVRDTLGLAGIDTDKFAPHSTRSASTSAAAAAGASIELIMKAASWSSEDTFSKFYNKPVSKSSFAGAVYKVLTD